MPADIRAAPTGALREEFMISEQEKLVALASGMPSSLRSNSPGREAAARRILSESRRQRECHDVLLHQAQQMMQSAFSGLQKRKPLHTLDSASTRVVTGLASPRRVGGVPLQSAAGGKSSPRTEQARPAQRSSATNARGMQNRAPQPVQQSALSLKARKSCGNIDRQSVASGYDHAVGSFMAGGSTGSTAQPPHSPRSRALYGPQSTQQTRQAQVDPKDPELLSTSARSPKPKEVCALRAAAAAPPLDDPVTPTCVDASALDSSVGGQDTSPIAPRTKPQRTIVDYPLQRALQFVPCKPDEPVEGPLLRRQADISAVASLEADGASSRLTWNPAWIAGGSADVGAKRADDSPLADRETVERPTGHSSNRHFSLDSGSLQEEACHVVHDSAVSSLREAHVESEAPPQPAAPPCAQEVAHLFDDVMRLRAELAAAEAERQLGGHQSPRELHMVPKETRQPAVYGVDRVHRGTISALASEADSLSGRYEHHLKELKFLASAMHRTAASPPRRASSPVTPRATSPKVTQMPCPKVVRATSPTPCSDAWATEVFVSGSCPVPVAPVSPRRLKRHTHTGIASPRGSRQQGSQCQGQAVASPGIGASPLSPGSPKGSPTSPRKMNGCKGVASRGASGSPVVAWTPRSSPPRPGKQSAGHSGASPCPSSPLCATVADTTDTDEDYRAATASLVERGLLSTVPSAWAEDAQGIPDDLAHVQALFVAQLPGASVLRVLRVENGGLRGVYDAMRGAMGGASCVAGGERVLWHGTSAENVRNIVLGGFNRAYCGRHGTKLGQGTYFSTDVCYSARFCDRQVGDRRRPHRTMILARVFVGTCTRGHPGLMEPPYRDGTQLSRYDSTADNADNPSIFCVFRDFQALPLYIVEFAAKPSSGLQVSRNERPVHVPNG